MSACRVDAAVGQRAGQRLRTVRLLLLLGSMDRVDRGQGARTKFQQTSQRPPTTGRQASKQATGWKLDRKEGGGERERERAKRVGMEKKVGKAGGRLVMRQRGHLAVGQSINPIRQPNQPAGNRGRAARDCTRPRARGRQQKRVYGLERGARGTGYPSGRRREGGGRSMIRDGFRRRLRGDDLPRSDAMRWMPGG